MTWRKGLVGAASVGGGGGHKNLVLSAELPFFALEKRVSWCCVRGGGGGG